MYAVLRKRDGDGHAVLGARKLRRNQGNDSSLHFDRLVRGSADERRRNRLDAPGNRFGYSGSRLGDFDGGGRERFRHLSHAFTERTAEHTRLFMDALDVCQHLWLELWAFCRRKLDAGLDWGQRRKGNRSCPDQGNGCGYRENGAEDLGSRTRAVVNGLGCQGASRDSDNFHASTSRS